MSTPKIEGPFSQGVRVPEILCVLIRYNSGEEVWEPWSEYCKNPPTDSFLVTDRRKIIGYYERTRV